MGWRARLKPPRWYGLDQDNPITRNLAFYSTPGKSQAFDLVSGGQGWLANEADIHFNGVTELGTALQKTALNTGTIGYFQGGTFGGAKSGVANIVRDCTMYFLGIVTTLNATHSVMVAVPWQTSMAAAPFFAVVFFIKHTNPTTALFGYADSGTTIATVFSDSSYALADGLIHHWAVTRRGATVTFYRDGFQFGSAPTLASNVDTNHGSRKPVILMLQSADTQDLGFIGQCLAAGIWSRALEPSEILSLYNEPWQMIEEPRVRPSYLIFVANAGPDQEVATDSATMAANGSVGSGTWSIVSGGGTIVDDTDPTTLIEDLPVGVSVFRWTIGSTSDDVTITRLAPPGALVEVFGILKDPGGFAPSSGAVEFHLEKAFDIGGIVTTPNFERAELDVDGRFTLNLRPNFNDRKYEVFAKTTHSGAPHVTRLGRIVIPDSPPSQNLADLLGCAGGGVEPVPPPPPPPPPPPASENPDLGGLPIELLPNGINSSIFGDITFARSQHFFNAARYTGANVDFYFEVGANNNTGADIVFYLVTSAGAVVASVTIPPTAGLYTWFRATEFTPPAGDVRLYVKALISGAIADLQVQTARIIVDMTQATGASIYIPLLGDDIVTTAANSWGSGESILQVGDTGGAWVNGLGATWLKDSTQYDELIDWTFEVILINNNEGSNNLFAGLWNKTTNSIVPASIIGEPFPVPDIYGYNYVTLNIPNGAANFADGDEYEFRCKYDTTWFGAGFIYKAGIFANVTNLTKVEAYLRVARQIPNSERNRVKVVPADWSNPVFFYEATGLKTAAGDLQLCLVDADSAISGNTGSPVAGSAVSLPSGTTGRTRSGAVTLDASSFYIQGQLGSTGGHVPLNGFIIIRATGIP